MISKEQELENLKKEYAECLYAISHDLSAPLNHIREFINIFVEDMPEDFPFTELQTKSLEIIQRSSALTEEMVKAVLLLSRLNADQPHTTMSLELPFTKAINDVFSLEDDIQSTLKLPTEWPLIEGDADQLYLMFKHVLDNAKKFQPESQKPSIEVNFSQTPTHWQCDVLDNGIGIPMEYAEDAFKVFRQLNRPHEYAGVGIGLALTHKVMTFHGGAAEFTQQDIGSCLRLSFQQPHKVSQ
ncbi:MAG: light-regulated signal transduction histidine kinase (bacteriophytochrome) [Alphaproteobacteria bacterium]|jgi:light-regulated signal transduction histidine kinase (bacteriophytochrome)